MAFGRSSSGPGGLSINTGSANSLFPNTSSQAPASGGLFSTSTSSQATTGGGIFGQASPGAGLFGSSSKAASSATLAVPGSGPPSQPGGLFGSSPAPAAGLFGASNQQAQAPPASGLFGSNTQQPQNAQGGGLFGSNSGATSLRPQPQQSGGLFGATQSQAQPQNPQQAGSLFGNPSATTASSLFGNPTPHAQPNNTAPAASGMFGGTTTTNQANAPFGGLSFGQPQATTLQPPNAVPGVKIDLSNLRPTTRFTDLHEDVQAEIEKLDAMILTQMDRAKQVAAFLGPHADTLTYLPNDVTFITHRVATLSSALENDAQAIAHVRDLTATDGADAKLSFRAVDNLKLPPQYHHHGSMLWNAPPAPNSRSSGAALDATTALTGSDERSGGPKDLIAFFAARADAMAASLDNYQQGVASVETHLAGVESRTAQQIQNLLMTRGQDGGELSATDQVRELAGVLRDFERGILLVAGTVGGAREGVQELELATHNKDSAGLGGSGAAGGKAGRR
ncbi:MAG: hypothetical protein M1838_000384 [Thelocarpon superellum]|nr:MAG: hypothetical protein M1838_000384 [Thelocarpon superellum]